MARIASDRGVKRTTPVALTRRAENCALRSAPDSGYIMAGNAMRHSIPENRQKPE